MGDVINFVIVFVGEFFKKVEEFLCMGFKIFDIVIGYEWVQKIVFDFFDEFEIDKVEDIWIQDELSKVICIVIVSKQNGNEEFFFKFVVEVVFVVFFKNLVNFNVDNVCVVKIMGGSLEQSCVVKGMVFFKEFNGLVKKVKKVKVGVFICVIDISQIEIKGIVLLYNVKEMFDFIKGEEL